MVRKFINHVLPTMIALTFSGIYSIIDGLFIGQKIGDVGLSAINIAYPLPAIIFALGAGIGMASGVLLSLHKDSDELQGKILGNSFILILSLSLICMVIFQIFHEPILLFFKASPTIMPYAKEYIQMVIFGIFFNMLGTALSPIVRNFEGQFMAMIAMCAGCVANVILDYIAIFPLNMGLSGAALATITSQAIVAIILLGYLYNRKLLFNFIKFKIDFDLIKQIFKIGISPFGISISSNIIIVIMNRQLALYGQDHAIAIYALISYVYYIAQLLMQGIGEGLQPLISRAIGLNKIKEAQTYLKSGLIFSFIFGIILSGILIWQQGIFPILFGTSQAVYNDFMMIFPLFALTSAFIGITKTITAYFYAAKHNKYAYLLIYLEPILVWSLTLLLPLFMRLQGVWISILITQIILAILASFILFITLKHQKILDI